MTQPGAATSTIVGRELLNTCLLCGVLHDMPDHLFRDPVSPDRARTIHTPEQAPVRNGRGLGPFIQGPLHQTRGRTRPDVSTFANQIPPGPMLLALLGTTHRELAPLAP